MQGEIHTSILWRDAAELSDDPTDSGNACCSPDLSPVKNVCRIMKRRIRQRLPWTVEAGEVLYQERLGKKSTCKTAAINLLSSEKCN